MVRVRGATLAGMAASARLARLGHEVTLVTDGAPRDTLPDAILLPAAWRDLFKKSGAHLVTALNGAGLELVEAPAEVHMLADGTRLELPTERGAQWRALSAQLGEDEATRWRDLVDDLDDVMVAFRRHALEGTLPVTTAAQRSALWLDRTLGDVAGRLTGGLRELVLACGPDADSPAISALPLSVSRTFGRWRLTPGGNGALVDLLIARLVERGVRIVDGDAGPVDLDCTGYGAAPRTAAEWLARAPIVGADGRLRASAASPAGPEPWAQLGSAALAVYELHERLTGEDSRPTNVSFRMPRPG